jgi:hypothetical protein
LLQWITLGQETSTKPSTWPISKVTLTRLTNINKWFPKFPGHNVIIVKDHIYVMGQDMDNEGIDHEDVAMKIFASSLTKESFDWFKGIPDNQIMTYDAFFYLI